MSKRIATVVTLLATVSCTMTPPPPPRVPALEYTKRLKKDLSLTPAGIHSADAFKSPATVVGVSQQSETPRARWAANVPQGQDSAPAAAAPGQQPATAPGFYEYRSSEPNTRDYNGPLSFGDPGLTASLWHESSAGNDIYRDQRAFQPMDLITIVVIETTKGEKKANTETKEKSNVQASINNLLGLEDPSNFGKINKNLDLSNLIKAATENNFKAEGTTKREGTLKARMSAMVAEVLPSGILRIEGEKIVSMNSEEEVMVISGLVRTRDITSDNEVDSSKIANLRIDFYGNGTLGEAQVGGWLGRFMRLVWPF